MAIEYEAMNSKEIFKDTFNLMVRLLGLYLFYVGLKDLDTPALLDVTVIEVEKPGDFISAVLPVIFNLTIAWWLLGSKFLTMRAYPATSQSSDHLRSPSEEKTPISEPHQTRRLTDMEAAEDRLAALVGKSKDGSLGQPKHGEDTKRVVMHSSASKIFTTEPA
jgi:hypothetical protein